MKLKVTNGGGGLTSLGSAFKKACIGSCHKVLARIGTAKETIFADSLKALTAQEHLLRLALNEAEAVSWETEYPHLVFPALAMEKVQAVIAWDAQQRFIRRTAPVYERAA